MYFKRKAYDKLLEWKQNYSDHYAVMLEGARRVGKSTIAETFAKNEYRSYIMLDFSKVSENILNIFDDIGNLNMFFLRLQAETGISLYEHESISEFCVKYSKHVQRSYLLSQKDIGKDGALFLKPFYLLPFLV